MTANPTVKDLRDKSWSLTDALTLAGASGVGAFLLGCVVTLFTQSSSATAILAVSATQAGLLPFEGAVPLVSGASVGSGISVLLVGGSVRGSQRQLVLCQGLTKLLGVAIIRPLVIIEDPSHRPLMLRVVQIAAANSGRQLALVYLACQVAALAALQYQPEGSASYSLPSRPCWRRRASRSRSSPTRRQWGMPTSR